MALYLVVVQAHFVMNNIFEGMIWFFLPAALVITNDIFAYICGIAFGRTQLIKLSPKKTVEGFVGAWIMTILFAMLLVNIMGRSKYFICPVNVRLATHTPCLRLLTRFPPPAGPRRQHLYRPRVRTEPRLPPSHLPPAAALFPAAKQ